jgi:hypothetical protein
MEQEWSAIVLFSTDQAGYWLLNFKQARGYLAA